MSLYPKVSLETSEKIKKISDEIGMITKKLLAAAENGNPVDPVDELRLKELKNELENLSAWRSRSSSHGRNNSGANQPAL